MRREAIKRQKEKKAPLVYRPEDRMRENAWLGTLIYSGALIWYGWTAENGVIWPVPVSIVTLLGWPLHNILPCRLLRHFSLDVDRC